MTQLCDLSACALRRAFAVGEASATDILESCLDRIEALNPHLNAIILERFDAARDEARAQDAAAQRGERLGPLAGLPAGVKDLNDVQGLPTTFGSALFETNVPERDDDTVASLKAAGAIVVGKTNVPEHGFGATTTSPLYGITRNPFDPRLSAGASTGGGAVALAAGMTPIATGSDFAGSLRTPAAFCGLTGVRPSNGVVGTTRRAMGWSPFDVEGPMGRSAADCKLVLSAMARKDPGDPLSAHPDAALARPAEITDLGALRAAFSEDLGFAPVSIEMRAVFREKIARFADRFALTEETAPDLGDAERSFYALRGVGFVADFGPMADEFGDKLGPVVMDELARARRLSIDDIGAAEKAHTKAFRAAAQFFERFDVLITPAASVAPFPHEEDHPAEIDGVSMGGYLKWEAIAWGVTLTQCPAVVIPCGRDRHGLPFGLQLVGAHRRDGRLLDIAHTLETLFADQPDLARPVPDIASLMASAVFPSQ